jgi:hypothetical protein
MIYNPLSVQVMLQGSGFISVEKTPTSASGE